MTLVLALDSALAGCGAAVVRGAAVLAAARDESARGQAERLLPLVETVLAEAGVTLAAIDRIAVTVGPGRFTGLRIGLSAARGLALALDRPVYGVTVTDALAAAAGTGGPLAVVIDALKADAVFMATYAADGTPIQPPASLSPMAARALITPDMRLCGDGVARLGEGLANPVLPLTAVDPAVLGRLAAARTDGGNHPADLRPLYLREADVTLAAPRPAPV